MRRDLPAGTVTFLFTDVEGSTKLLHELGAEAYAEKLAEHRVVVREACTARHGVEVDTQGDAFFVAFSTAPEALKAARAITEELASGPITLRIGLHTGTPLLTEEGYVGEDVHFAARLAASAHGGQVVLSQATRALIDERYALLDLGEHRLKDIPEPVAIYQLGDGQFPPLKTISNTNLPRPASSFVGRERELQEVLARIEAGARLVTLTGPGGTGKTRLALEAAATLVPAYKAGVFWVGLASLHDPTLVSETIAQTLGAKDGLADHIGEREMLLLLDNLEQVVEAAPELSSLLQRCPNLALLVTSRELLRVQGEVEYPVPPLAEAEAFSLFCERAQAEPNEEISELCRRLDNLPLAVELAAARTNALSPAQILERLSGRLDLLKGGRDADPRQRTLRATIEWSHDLLSAREQQLFRRVAVFASGCTFEAAETVCDADLDTLQSLIEKSLFRYGNQRYWMLETVREYAAERLEEHGELKALRHRHAQFLLQFARRAADELAGLEHAGWVERLEAERDNLRAALTWSLDAEPPAVSLFLAAAFGRLCRYRGGIDEGRRWLDAALGTRGDQPPLARSKALYAAASLAYMQKDLERAHSLAEECLALARSIDDAQGIGRALIVLGLVAGERSEYDRCEAALTEARAAFSESGNEREATFALHMLGFYATTRRDYARARSLIEEALAQSRRQNDNGGIIVGTGNLASVLREEGRIREALPLFRESLLLAHEILDATRIVENLGEIAAAVASQRDYDGAAIILGGAEALRESIGLVLPPSSRSNEEEALALLRRELDADRLERCMGEGHAMTADQLVAFAVEWIDGALRKLEHAVEPTG
jgi:predicted ATPase/class 3 adenylate cyclase